MPRPVKKSMITNVILWTIAGAKVATWTGKGDVSINDIAQFKDDLNKRLTSSVAHFGEVLVVNVQPQIVDRIFDRLKYIFAEFNMKTEL